MNLLFGPSIDSFSRKRRRSHRLHSCFHGRIYKRVINLRPGPAVTNLKPPSPAVTLAESAPAAKAVLFCSGVSVNTRWRYHYLPPWTGHELVAVCGPPYEGDTQRWNFPQSHLREPQHSSLELHHFLVTADPTISTVQVEVNGTRKRSCPNDYRLNPRQACRETACPYQIHHRWNCLCRQLLEFCQLSIFLIAVGNLYG